MPVSPAAAHAFQTQTGAIGDSGGDSDRHLLGASVPFIHHLKLRSVAGLSRGNGQVEVEVGAFQNPGPGR